MSPMRRRLLCLWAWVPLALAACGSVPVEYQKIELLSPLQVPEGLQPPRTNDTMAIPGLPLADVEMVRRRLSGGEEAKDIELPPGLRSPDGG